jgi:hypothetical protein
VISPLLVQTIYAELLERCANAAFSEAFPEKGTFTSKSVRDRKYWYFQTTTPSGRVQRYVGPETPDLLDRIARHRQERHDERERGTMVSTLLRLGMPRPDFAIGRVVAALAGAGVFRLRSVLVGTVAFQTYSATLGEKLIAQTARARSTTRKSGHTRDPYYTEDIDIAQFTDISILVADHVSPVLDILREVDDTFRAIPHATRGRQATKYQAESGLRVDFLTPNRGPDSDEPRRLASLQTDAQPLRFLDFLVYDPEPAVVLHGGGVYVSVPRPERYALHKLIISQRRREDTVKRDKDIQQAAALLAVLAEKRPHELRGAWEEAVGRGKAWRDLLGRGLAQVLGEIREGTLKAVNERRQVIPDLNLTFQNPPARYDFDRDIVAFEGAANGDLVECAISREALEDHFGADELDAEGRLEVFRRNRSLIERLAREKFLTWPIDKPNSVLIGTIELPDLMRALPVATRRRRR